jgi:hypothetical protein
MKRIPLIGASLCILLMGVLVPSQLVAGKRLSLEESLNRKWQGKLEAADALLVEKNWEDADKMATSITKEMMIYVTGGGSEWMGAAATVKALAAAGSGREDDAVWYWDVARQLFPSVEEVDLSRYGEAGAFLRECDPPMNEIYAALSPPEFEIPEKPVVQGDFEPPVRKKAPRPRFPLARQGRVVTVTLTLKAIIDEEGRLQRPVIVESAGEITMVYSSLETLRKWRFRPAMQDGKPIRVIYTLDVNFRGDG